MPDFSKVFAESPTSPPGSCSLAISVIVPCRNESREIEASVRSMLSLTTPADGFEIIVVDGMSDDGTRVILERLEKNEARLRIIDNPAKITPCAMNVGIQAARGQYIAIMGAHNRYAPDYLIAALAVLENSDVDNVGGAMLCEGDSWVQLAIAAVHHSPFSSGGAKWHDPRYEGPADTVFGGVYRRSVFDQIGYFDEELIRNQDDEFNLRLQKAGGKIWQSPQVKSWYRPRASLGALIQQYKQYGYWKVRVIQKHKMPASIRHLVPVSFVLSIGVLPVASVWFPLAGKVWLGLIVLYFLCNLGASFATARNSGWKLIPLLPIIFACYHFSYGYGFLRGILDFVVLRRGPGREYSKLTRIAAKRHFFL